MFDSLSSIHTIEDHFLLGGASVPADATSNSHAPPAAPRSRRVCKRPDIHSRHAEPNSGRPELLNRTWLFPANHRRALTYDYAYQIVSLYCLHIFTPTTSNTYTFIHLFLSLSHTLSLSLFVLQSFHKALPSTTLYYKTSTQHVPVLLCTTKLPQSTSQYYFILHSFHKARPSTTAYYHASTKHWPVLLCTTKLPHSTSQYYFVLQSFHKALTSTTSYYTASTKHVTVLLRATKLPQSTSQY